jgi:hypothetical protein
VLLGAIGVRQIVHTNSLCSQRLLKLRPLRIQALKIATFASRIRVHGPIARDRYFQSQFSSRIGFKDDSQSCVATLT